MAWSSSNRAKELPKNWYVIRRRILRRDNYTCQMKLSGCLNTATEVDHIVRGSDHTEPNLRACCSHCHSKKSAYEGNSERSRRKRLKIRPPENHPGSRRPLKNNSQEE